MNPIVYNIIEVKSMADILDFLFAIVELCYDLRESYVKYVKRKKRKKE